MYMLVDENTTFTTKPFSKDGMERRDYGVYARTVDLARVPLIDGTVLWVSFTEGTLIKELRAVNQRSSDTLVVEITMYTEEEVTGGWKMKKGNSYTLNVNPNQAAKQDLTVLNKQGSAFSVKVTGLNTLDTKPLNEEKVFLHTTYVSYNDPYYNVNADKSKV